MPGEIFISYRRSDEAWARMLHDQLAAEEVEAWYDAHIGAGQDWRSATARALQDSRIFVLLFSAAAAQSEDIAKELAAAIFSKKLVVPVRIEDIQPTGAFLYELASRNWVNAFENTEAKLSELARSLAKLVKSGIADESVIAFDRNAGAKAPAKPWRQGPVLIPAAALLLAATAAGLFWLHPKPASTQPAATRVVVLPFDTLDDKAGASGFGKAVAEQIISTLNDVQVQTVSREDTAAMSGAGRDAIALKNGAEFVLNGSVQKGDKGLHVTAHLDHALTHATVWTANYDQAVAGPLEFQAQIAVNVSDVVKSALKARQTDPAEMTDAALAIFLKYVEEIRTQSEAVKLQQRDLTRQLIVLAPKFSTGYSGLAIVSAILMNWALPDDIPQLRADVKKAAGQALAIEPRDPVAYIALGLLIPTGRWAEREAAFRKGLTDPPDPNLQSYVGHVLFDVGRLREALVVRRNVQLLDPLGASKNGDLAQILVETGHVAEGLALMERAAKLWPSNSNIWPTRFDVMANFGHIADARTMLDTPQYIPATVEPAAIAARRAYLDALAHKTPAARLGAENSIRSAMTSGAIAPQRGMQMFAALGDVDGAFTVATLLFSRKNAKPVTVSTAPLFVTVTQSMRRDPRFMPLAAQAGLVDYWMTTGKWPDFCAVPGLPYDCRAVAEELTAPGR